MRTFYTLLGVILWLIPLSSQDLHYSQFFNSPLNINPALTGVFSGDTRVSGNYRSQWQSVPVNYLTFTGSIDHKINSLSAKRGIWNVGFMFDYDKAGDLSLSLGNLNLTSSYTYIINRRNLLTPGILVGYNQRRYDPSQARTGNQWNGRAFDPSTPAEFLAFDNKSFFDFGFGLNYRWQRHARQFIDLGVAAYHLFSPSQTFEEDPDYLTQLPRRFNIYGMSTLEMTSRIDLLLNAIYQNQHPYQELVLNVQGKLYLNTSRERDMAVLLGFGFRPGDAWYPMVAIQYENIHAGFSYDRNISGFDFVTNGNGGPELSIRYTLAKVPNSAHKPCPIY